MATPANTALITPNADEDVRVGELMPPIRVEIAAARQLALTHPEKLICRGSTLRGFERLKDATRRAYLSDWLSFLRCCRQFRQQPLPATQAALETFIEWRSPFRSEIAEKYHYVGKDAPREAVASASLARALAAISSIHAILKYPNPVDEREIQDAFSIHTEGRREQTPREPLLWKHIERALSRLEGSDLRTLRNKALVAVAHSTLLRRSELVKLTREQYSRDPDEEFGRMRVGVTKTTDGSKPAYRHVTPEAVTHLEAWLNAGGITEGYIFRGILPGGRFRTRPSEDGVPKWCHLEAGQVAIIFKSIARMAGLDDDLIGGHSTRIGATHDLKSFGANTHDIMHDGGWQTPAMVNRYTAGFSADEGAMAKMARARQANKGNG